jgi:hypothetical protein
LISPANKLLFSVNYSKTETFLLLDNLNLVGFSDAENCFTP